MKIRPTTILAWLSLACSSALSLDAAVEVRFKETVSGVTATLSGTANILDLTGTTNSSFGITEVGSFFGFHDEYIVGPSSTVYLVETGISGPLEGSWVQPGASRHIVTSTVGDKFAIQVSETYIRIGFPDMYVSGASISNVSQWDGETIDSLQLIPGTYVYTWGSGENADSLTLYIPESNSAYYLLAILAALFVHKAYKRRNRDIVV